MNREFLNAALQYLRHGWSVIPLRPNSKLPMVQWVEFQTRHATPAEVEGWWNQTPGANIGVVTGAISGIVVVDVDPRHGGQAEPIHRSHHTGLVQRTAGRGSHLVYRYPGGVDWIPNRASVQQGVDVRADGGYIVVAPSAIDGKPYTWLGTLADAGTVPPPWAIREEPEAKGEKVEKWLADALEGVREGERNDTLARIAGYFAAKEVPPDVAMQILRLWNTRNENPHTMTRREMEATIQSVYRRNRRRKRNDSSPRAGPSVVTGRGELPLSTWERYAARFGNKEIEWQIDGWLPAASIGFLVSPPGMYKTWLLLDAAVSIACNRPFLGKWAVRRPGPVVLVQQEDHHASIVDRVSSIVWSRFGLVDLDAGEEFSTMLPPTIPIHVHPNRALRFDDADVVAAFATTLRRIKPTLVIIDPLYTAVSSDNYMVEAAERMLVLKALRDELGTTFMIAHHTRKTGSYADVTTERTDAWGSQFLNAFLETGWQVRPTPVSDTIRVLRHFKITGSQEELGLQWNIQDNENVYAVSEVEIPETKDGTRGNEVRALLNDKPQSVRAIARELNIHPNSALRVLKKLAAEGQAERDDETKGWKLSDDYQKAQMTIGEVL